MQRCLLLMGSSQTQKGKDSHTKTSGSVQINLCIFNIKCFIAQLNFAQVEDELKDTFRKNLATEKLLPWDSFVGTNTSMLKCSLSSHGKRLLKATKIMSTSCDF